MSAAEPNSDAQGRSGPHPIIRARDADDSLRQSGTIGTLISARHFAPHDARLRDFSLEIVGGEIPEAIAVVDGQRRPMGLVIKRELQERLSKLYWRDLHNEDPIASHLLMVPVLDASLPILSAAEQLLPDLSESVVRYFLITREGVFTGILSSLDLLRYLSLINQKDMDLAKALQGRITPARMRFKAAKGTVFAYSQMAKGIGGDFYRCRTMPDGRVLAAECDVSGKGVAASLVTAVIAGMMELYEQSPQREPLERFLQKLNRFLCQTFEFEKFVTGLFIEWSPENRHFQIYDCGHGMTFLWRRGSFHEVHMGDRMPPLGVDPEAVPGRSDLTLEPGDVLLVCTDGVMEQTNPAHEEFGSRRLAEATHRCCREGRIDGLSDAVLRDLNHFRGTQVQQDDITMLYFLQA